MPMKKKCFTRNNSPQIKSSLSATMNPNSHFEFFYHLVSSECLNFDTKKGIQLLKTEKQKLYQQDTVPCPPFRYSATYVNPRSIISNEVRLQAPKKKLQMTRLSYNHKNESTEKDRFPSQHKIQTKSRFYSVFKGHRDEEKIAEVYRTIRKNKIQKKDLKLQNSINKSCKSKEQKSKPSHATFDYDGTLIEVISPPLQKKLEIQIHTPVEANIQLDSQYVNKSEGAKASANSEDLLRNSHSIQFYLSQDTKKIKQYESDYLRNFHKIEWKKGIEEYKAGHQPEVPKQGGQTSKNATKKLTFDHPNQLNIFRAHTKKAKQPNIVKIVNENAYRENLLIPSNLNPPCNKIQQKKVPSINSIANQTKYLNTNFKSVYKRTLKKKVGLGNRKRNYI